MASPHRSRAVAHAFGQEALGALTAVTFAVVALRHLLGTNRIALLWYDADSVLLPLVQRSLRLGQAFEWAMSPALFFFPELPVYLLCAAVTTTPQAALSLNGVLVIVAVYALVRAVAAQLMPEATRSTRIVVSAGAVGVVTALVLTESTATAASLELASLLLTTTYYYGVVLAMLGTAALALRVVRVTSAPGDRDGTAWGSLAAVVLLAALTTASDPLYVPWSAGPVIATVGVLALARRVPWTVVTGLTVALAVGSGGGYLLRIPLAPFVSLDPSTYIHPGRALQSVQWFAALTDDRASSVAGVVELVLLFLLFAISVAGTVWAWRTRSSRTVLVATTLSVTTVLAVSAGVVVSGADAPRYLEPVVTAPLVALVAVAELARTQVRRTRLHRGRVMRVVAIVGTAAVLAAGILVVPSTVSTVRGASSLPAACLDRWAAGRVVQGVGQFWTVRPVAAYADDGVRLLQVQDDFDAYPWLTNLAAYRDARPTFVLVGAGDVWTTPVQDTLGDPADVVHCSGYDIYDYAGTRGAAVLRRIVVGSAAAVRLERGFGD